MDTRADRGARVQQRSHRKLPPHSQLEESSRHIFIQLLNWTQSPHPARMADEDVEVHSTETLRFRLVIIV
jgi:hypothetical protein